MKYEQNGPSCDLPPGIFPGRKSHILVFQTRRSIPSHTFEPGHRIYKSANHKFFVGSACGKIVNGVPSSSLLTFRRIPDSAATDRRIPKCIDEQRSEKIRPTDEHPPPGRIHSITPCRRQWSGLSDLRPNRPADFLPLPPWRTCPAPLDLAPAERYGMDRQAQS